MGNKQEEMEDIGQQESYHKLSWRHGGKTLTTGMPQRMSVNSSEALSKDRQAVSDRQPSILGRGLSVWTLMMVMKIKCLGVRIRGKADKADILVGVCHRPFNQDKKASEIFYNLGEVS